MSHLNFKGAAIHLKWQKVSVFRKSLTLLSGLRPSKLKRGNMNVNGWTYLRSNSQLLSDPHEYQHGFIPFSIDRPFKCVQNNSDTNIPHTPVKPVLILYNSIDRLYIFRGFTKCAKNHFVPHSMNADISPFISWKSVWDDPRGSEDPHGTGGQHGHIG